MFNLELIDDVVKAVSSAIGLVEVGLDSASGAEKKAAVVEAVLEGLNDTGVKLPPIVLAVIRRLLPLAIDGIVRYGNAKGFLKPSSKK